MDPHDEGFKSNEALETTLVWDQSSNTGENEGKMVARGREGAGKRKTNDALLGSRRIHYDGLPLFQPYTHFLFFNHSVFTTILLTSSISRAACEPQNKLLISVPSPCFSKVKVLTNVCTDEHTQKIKSI